MNVIASGTPRYLGVDPDGHRGCVREHRRRRLISEPTDEHDAFELIERAPWGVDEILAGCAVPALRAGKKLDAYRAEPNAPRRTTDRRARVLTGEGGRYRLQGANR